MKRKLREAYKLQRQKTRYFASLTALAGPDTVARWLKIPVDENAPTPQTFRAKEKEYPNSVYRTQVDARKSDSR